MARDSTNEDSSDRHSGIQRISRLTPLSAIVALIDSGVGPVRARQCEAAAAVGLTLADDLITAERPAHPIALADGFAVDAAAVADAGPYTPVPLSSPPQWVEAGAALPSGTDAVAPRDAIARSGERIEVIAPIAAGQGVLPVGGDAAVGTMLRRAGERSRAIDCAIAAALGFAELNVREPRVCIARGNTATTPLLDASLSLVARFVGKSGATVRGDLTNLHEALAREDADAVIAVGGTGGGRHDTAVQTLARLGRVEAHGVAISPGETTAFGFAGARPVLLIPGRLDAALAAWLLIGSRIVAKLSGRTGEDETTMLPLKRKVTSAIGMTELVPVRCADGMAKPLASGYLSLMALARSDGWIVVPADSEGYASGTPVAVKPWP